MVDARTVDVLVSTIVKSTHYNVLVPTSVVTNLLKLVTKLVTNRKKMARHESVMPCDISVPSRDILK